MPLKFYFDEHVPKLIAVHLGGLGVDVLRLQDDAISRPDVWILERATSLGRVVFTMDRDFLREGSARQRNSVFFEGIIYVHQDTLSFGKIIERLYLICQASEPVDLQNQVFHLTAL